MPTPRLSELLEGASFLKVNAGQKLPVGQGWQKAPPLAAEDLEGWFGNIGLYIDRPLDEYSEAHVCVDVDRDLMKVRSRFPWLDNTLSIYRQGKLDGAKFIFIKGSGEFASSHGGDVELFAKKGRQVVVHGNYDGDRLLNNGKPAVTITDDQWHELLEEYGRKPTAPQAKPGTRTYTPYEIPVLWEMARHYPPPNDYEQFLGLLLSLKSEVGTYPDNELYAIFDSICQRGQGYNAEKNFQNWSSSKPDGRRSIGSFVKGCMDGGWEPPKRERKVDDTDGVLLSDKGPLSNILKSFAVLARGRVGFKEGQWYLWDGVWSPSEFEEIMGVFHMEYSDAIYDRYVDRLKDYKDDEIKTKEIGDRLSFLQRNKISSGASYNYLKALGPRTFERSDIGEAPLNHLCVLYKGNRVVVNLNTGSFEDARPEHGLIAGLDIEWNRDREPDLYHRWLEACRNVLPNSDVLSFMQEALGAALAGVRQKRYLWLYGPPDAGKSTFVRCIEQTVSRLHCAMLPDDVSWNKHNSNHNGSLKNLVSNQARIATYPPETNRLRLDVGLLKSLTGNDRIEVRGAGDRRNTSGTPVALPILFSNAFPQMDMDEALKRRQVVVGFDHPQERGTKLGDWLEDCDEDLKRCVLHWLIRGAVRCEGTAPVPPEVLDAVQSEAYEFQDAVGEWLEANRPKIIGETAQSVVTMVDEGLGYETGISGKGMALKLSNRRFTKTRSNGITRWYGYNPQERLT